MGDQTHGTVLIVEDESELRFILAANLRAAGYAILETEEGGKAIELATEAKPDLIIMDVGLPGMDGVVATRMLKSHDTTSHIPVIMLTARSTPKDVVRGLEAGAQEYLSKPFDVTELLARVRTVHRLSVARQDLNRLNTQLEAEVSAKTQRLQILYEFMRDLHKANSRDHILDLLIQCVKEAVDVKRISLFVTDATGEYLVCERAVGMDPKVAGRIRTTDVAGITGQVFTSGKTLAARAYGTGLQDTRGYDRDAFLCTPLVSTSLETQDGIVGVLNVTDKADDSPFSEEEIECIRSIADATAIALDNVVRRGRLRQSVRILLQTVGHLAEFRDEETTLHIERVTKMARILAQELQRKGAYAELISRDFVEWLVQAAPMHDIGKVGIPDDILTKPGALTDEEFQIMKTHTDIGRRVLSRALDPASPNPLLQMCIEIAHCHHERYDGTGYPRRLCDQDIPLSARIIALVDAYDAITSRRRYKEARSHEDAVEIIRGDSGTHFDPVVVEAFLRCEEQFSEVRQQHADTAQTVEAAMA